MENQQISTVNFSLPHGLYLGFILILISVLMYATGIVYEGIQWPIYIYYLIFPVFIGYTINLYRTKNGGFLTLIQALKVGVTVAVINGLCYVVYNFIFVYIIEPDFMNQMMELAREKIIEENPNMPDDQMEMALKIAKGMTNPVFGGAFFIVMSAFFGFIYSLISGLIFKRENPNEM